MLMIRFCKLFSITVFDLTITKTLLKTVSNEKIVRQNINNNTSLVRL